MNSYYSIILEEIGKTCISIWAYPISDKNGNVQWRYHDFECKNGDDLTNWLVILYKMRIGWNFEIDFSSLSHDYRALPHAIVMGDKIYHCGNFPLDCSLKKICDDLLIKATPVMDKELGIKQDQLDKLEELLGKDLGLIATD